MSRLLLLSLACLLAACGQKGALYLPAKPVVPVTVPEAPQPTPAASPEATPASVPAEQESTAKDAKDTPATAPRP